MKLVLINCYFGTLPNYFPLWLQSCGMNPKIDFILVTDAIILEPKPQNVTVILTTLDELKKRIDEKIGFKTTITSPYKLTDFKPAYGVIFEDYFKQYDYWGYCDVDLIFGDLMKFVEYPMSQGYEMIYRLGHLTIYKNTSRMNHLFQQPGGAFSYKEVFKNPEFYSFDEHAGQMLIAKRQGVSQYCREDMADISPRVRRITASRHENYPYQVFYYENGSVCRAFIKDEIVKTEEFAYIHIQKRAFTYSDISGAYYILSNRFEKKDAGPDAETIIQLSEYESIAKDQEYLSKYQKGKLWEFIRSSIREKSIWLKIKRAERLISKLDYAE